MSKTVSSDAPGARELTRRLVARAAKSGDSADSALSSVQAACERTYRVLTRSLGSAGSRGLLSRALTQSQAEHPALSAISVGRQEGRVFEGVPSVLETHGAPAVTAALEALLERSIGLLGRLIGDDMVERLLEGDAAIGTLDDEDGT